jgi:choline dehydrogenase
MLYVRGAPADFDGWAQMGCRGWSYDDVLPFFRKSETYAQQGDPEVRGQNGPLKVEDYRTILPLTHQFVKAAQEAGFPFNPTSTASKRYGVGYSQMTAARPLARLDGADPSCARRGSGRTCGSRPTRRRQAAASRASAASASSSSRGGNTTDGAANPRGDRVGGTVNSPHILQISGTRARRAPAESGHSRAARFAGRRRRNLDRPLVIAWCTGAGRAHGERAGEVPRATCRRSRNSS